MNCKIRKQYNARININITSSAFLYDSKHNGLGQENNKRNKKGKKYIFNKINYNKEVNETYHNKIVNDLLVTLSKESGEAEYRHKNIAKDIKINTRMLESLNLYSLNPVFRENNIPQLINDRPTHPRIFTHYLYALASFSFVNKNILRCVYICVTSEDCEKVNYYDIEDKNNEQRKIKPTTKRNKRAPGKSRTRAAQVS